MKHLFNRGGFFIVLLFTLTIVSSYGAGVPSTGPFSLADVPFTSADPVMDGMATSYAEWAQAFVYPDLFGVRRERRAGWYWIQQKQDWRATSVQTSSQNVISGRTLFVAHDIVGSADPNNPLNQFRIQEDSDWNSFSFPTPRGTVKIWIFANGNTADDTTWIDGAEGLASSPLIPEGSGNDLIDDRGFIVRLNNNPATDRHWRPGDPEPGDLGWDPEAFYGCFGRASFGQSFQTTGLDTNPNDAVAHEVYEFSCSYPAASPPNECIWWEEIIIKTIDDRIKREWVLRGDFWLHFWCMKFPPGQPSVTERFNWIADQLRASASSIAANDSQTSAIISKAAESFSAVGNNGGSLNASMAFDRIAEGLGSLITASKVSTAYRDILREYMNHALAGAQDEVITEIVALDLRGTAASNDKQLTKSYKSLRSAGKKLEALRKIDGNPTNLWRSILKEYRKAYNALVNN